jgi:phosphocarrier protein
MQERTTGTYTIINELGLHARAAATFVKIANRFRSLINVTKDSITVNGKSIMGVLMLAAAKDAVITIDIEGSDADQALKALGKLIDDKFGEEK